MSNTSPDLLSGERLREWRISQNRDISDLAKCASLSIAQIRQLETGGTSLFYSPSIRANAAKKVALLLGADPRLVVDRKMAPDEPNSSHQALEDLIVFLQPKPPSFIEQHAGSIVMVLLMLASLIAMIF